MTDEQIQEMLAYFETKELPKTFSYPGATITNCKNFVETHIHRIGHGVPLNARASLDALVRFNNALETKKPNH